MLEIIKELGINPTKLGCCIVGAVANFAIFALTIPEARKAISALRDGS